MTHKPITSMNKHSGLVQVAQRHQMDCCQIGCVVSDWERKATVKSKSLIGIEKHFLKV